MNGTNGNEPGYPENALVPYPVIVVATKGGRPSCAYGRGGAGGAAEMGGDDADIADDRRVGRGRPLRSGCGASAICVSEMRASARLGGETSGKSHVWD